MLEIRKPAWLKVRAPGGANYTRLKGLLRRLALHTVCEEAQCPNMGECWGGGTATFMLMGDVCTRGCRFCAVTSGKPGALDPREPENLARAIGELSLRYAVITSVDRDDLPDGGASHFAACISAVRLHAPDTLVEVLIPDFLGDEAALLPIVAAGPNVAAHNIETVRRLTPHLRDRRCSYDLSLEVLSRLKALGASYTKSSIMVGVGERDDEVVESLQDLRRAGVDVVTLGQYLRPSKKHLAVLTYVSPETFDRYAEIGRELGFLYVASGPLVRSSYRAGEFFMEGVLRQQAKECGWQR